LNSPAEEFSCHADIDKKRPLFDKDGAPRSFDELAAAAGPEMAAQIEMAVLRERAARSQAGLERISTTLREARLDALIVVGDDQYEQFFDDNMPAALVYWGDSIVNNVLPLPPDSPDFWKRARSQYHEPDGVRSYPVASDLALHLIDELMDRDFDISQAKKLRMERGEGHALGFVHRRLMRDHIIPVVPVLLNTYYAPNQPRPRRCYELGQAIRAAVESWDRDWRVGILASGGLSHFTVDETLDRRILDACRQKDRESLVTLPLNQLNSGSSEIRNWITVAGAAEKLSVQWDDYIPCYRSMAGTGVGVAYAVWQQDVEGNQS
jgi:3-O-methylgallate 3,4-dioxygenase